MSHLDEVEFAINPDPRCPCVLLLDTSGSMEGANIDALNQGLQAFQQDVSQHNLARRRVEVAIVTFGNGGVQTLQDFVTADKFSPPPLSAGGDTPMGAAINRALDMLNARKAQYKANAIAYYRPWVFMLTDGAPTDSWQAAAQRVRTEDANKAVAFFTVAVEGADIQTLAQIAPPTRKPVKLQGLMFVEMFRWLSRSQQRVSSSKPGENVGLPPVDGWAEV
jgi:uncharacterized protein YegL